MTYIPIEERYVFSRRGEVKLDHLTVHFHKGRCYFCKFNEETDPEKGVSYHFRIIGIILKIFGCAETIPYVKEGKNCTLYANKFSVRSWIRGHSLDRGVVFSIEDYNAPVDERGVRQIISKKVNRLEGVKSNEEAIKIICEEFLRKMYSSRKLSPFYYLSNIDPNKAPPLRYSEVIARAKEKFKGNPEEPQILHCIQFILTKIGCWSASDPRFTYEVCLEHNKKLYYDLCPEVTDEIYDKAGISSAIAEIAHRFIKQLPQVEVNTLDYGGRGLRALA
ncbi:hypothetical protein PHSC3_001380 [Chlamydiales bacterium STE3]|nr:hypothetical protein PHSC3_001380 [Chlamydiales bacterium STE3]